MERRLMGRVWCRDLPVVMVETGSMPKRVTLVYPFYENHQFLQTQMAHSATWPADLREHLEVIVVDDGSPAPLRLMMVPGVRVRQFRIDIDVRWNWLAARNIGAHHACGEWLLLTDIDHVVPAATMRTVIFGQHDPSMVYAFSRREHTGAEATPHSASFLMTKDLFWTIGGYDESLSGFYGTDGDYRRRMAEHARMAIMSEPLVRYEYVDDSSTTRYKRKQPEDAAVRCLVAARGRGWKPKTLSFPYHPVALEGTTPCLAQQ